MNLIIYINSHFEEEKALYDLDKNEALLKGDQYHDKIYEKIEGYLKALQDFNVYEKSVAEEYIDSNHEFYQQLSFYNEED